MPRARALPVPAWTARQGGHLSQARLGVYQKLGDEMDQVRAASTLGEALWARARAEHHQAASNATSDCSVSATGADTLQDAGTWLRTAHDLAVKLRLFNFRMDAQMHLAYVAMLKGDEDEAVELLSQHCMGGWTTSVLAGAQGACRCGGRTHRCCGATGAMWSGA